MFEIVILLVFGIGFLVVTIHELIKWFCQAKSKKPKYVQRRLSEYIMSDEYPYLKRYDKKTVEDMEQELYGESTAEIDLQDEEDN